MLKKLTLKQSKDTMLSVIKKKGKGRLAGTYRKFVKKHEKIWCFCVETSNWKLQKKKEVKLAGPPR